MNCGRQEGGYVGLGEWLFGYNARLTELQAAVLSAQPDALPERTARRAAAVERLSKGLESIPGLTPLPHDERVTTRAAYEWVLRYDADAFAGVPRDHALAALHREGVPVSGRFYRPLVDDKLFARDEMTNPAARSAAPRSRRIEPPTRRWSSR